MIKINLSKTELENIKSAIKKEKNVKVYRRLQSLLMKNEGLTNIFISDIIGVRNDSLTDWFRIYTEEGLEKLTTLNYDHNKISKIDKYKEEIEQFIKNNKIKNSMEINNFLEKEHNLKIDNSWLVKYLKKNSIFPIRKPN